MVELGQQRMSKKGRATPLSTLLPKVQNISLGTGGFEAHILEFMKDNMLRLATKRYFRNAFLLNYIHVLGAC